MGGLNSSLLAGSPQYDRIDYRKNIHIRGCARYPIKGSPIRQSLSTTLLPSDAGKNGFGLFRLEAMTSGPANSMRTLFANLRTFRRGQIIGEDLQRDMQGTRLVVNSSQGHGQWEFYRLGNDLYVIVGDGVFDATSRVETLLGEGLVEFHLRLAGVLELTIPGSKQPLIVTGPSMLMLHQPPGVNVPERVRPECRDTAMSLFCRPQYLAKLAERNGIERWRGLEEIELSGAATVWHRQAPLTPTLLHIANSLLRCPYQGGVRLLHAEAKALELLCEILTISINTDQPTVLATPTECEERRLDMARKMLASQLSSAPSTFDIARSVGMSETKLKRTFKARFGVTIFNYGLECRMRHALELLRCKRMPVGQVAQAVGYQHQTSFTAAFHQFFGFLPNQARRHMH
jgi:AraC-like DNA-binding protein